MARNLFSFSFLSQLRLINFLVSPYYLSSWNTKKPFTSSERLVLLHFFSKDKEKTNSRGSAMHRRAYYRDIATDCSRQTLSLYLSRSLSICLCLPINVSRCPMYTSRLIRRANVSSELTTWHWAKARANRDCRSEAHVGRWNADKKQWAHYD